MTFLAYHLHWPLAELMDLPHRERRAWVGEVSAINATLNADLDHPAVHPAARGA